MEKNKSIEQIRQFERFGSVLGLERISVLMDKLGNPQDSMNVIHVAGTNGKGSVCRYIYEVLCEHGYRTGIYISPFIETFYERMEVAGERITEAELDKHTDAVMIAVNEMVHSGMDSPTEFEVLTAVAFLYFKEKDVEFLVLEVGLGGIGDSTNVIKKPIFSVITSISLDHTDRLGETISEIAREKAGIIKPGAPVIIGELPPEAEKVVARIAYEKNAPLINAGKIHAKCHEKSAEGYRFSANIKGSFYENIKVTMPGMHQVKNAVTALTTIEMLRQGKYITTSRDEILAGMEKAVQPGRFEIINTKQGLYVLDGAHNESGAEVFSEAMKELFAEKRVLMILGVLGDKRLDEMLPFFDSVTDEYIATEPENERKLSADVLQQKITGRCKACICAPDVKEAIAKADKMKDDFDIVAVTGSLYLIGAARTLLQQAK